LVFTDGIRPYLPTLYPVAGQKLDDTLDPSPRKPEIVVVRADLTRLTEEHDHPPIAGKQW
jgi:hypothetical protein